MHVRLRSVVVGVLLAGVVGLGGCAAVVGAGAVAGTYEYKHKKALDQLNKEYEAGQITKEEYLKRKQEIDKGSFVY